MLELIGVPSASTMQSLGIASLLHYKINVIQNVSGFEKRRALGAEPKFRVLGLALKQKTEWTSCRC